MVGLQCKLAKTLRLCRREFVNSEPALRAEAGSTISCTGSEPRGSVARISLDQIKMQVDDQPVSFRMRLVALRQSGSAEGRSMANLALATAECRQSQRIEMVREEARHIKSVNAD